MIKQQVIMAQRNKYLLSHLPIYILNPSAVKGNYLIFVKLSHKPYILEICFNITTQLAT